MVVPSALDGTSLVASSLATRHIPSRPLAGIAGSGDDVPVSGSGSARTLGVVGSLYVAQGIVYGFGGFILVPSLAAAGVALEAQAGLLALAGLPWVLKLLWAPVLDRFGGIGSGRARWFAAGAMVAMAIALVGLASRPSLVADPGPVTWLWLLVNVGLSLQDVATDALVLDRVAPEGRGFANGVILGGHHLGAEGVGSLGLGLLVASQGLSAALWAQAAIMLVIAGLPLVLPRTVDGEEGAPPAPMALGRTLLTLLRSRRTLWVLALAAVLSSANVLTSTISGQFWILRLGWTVEALSTRLAPILLGMNLVAYAISTVVVDRMGANKAAVAGSVALGSLWLGFGAVSGLWDFDAFVVGFAALEAMATALFYVGIHAALMNATVPALRASHFAVLMALFNLPRAVVAPFAPAVLESLGYAGVFMAAGAFQVALSAVIAWVRPGQDPAAQG